MDLIKKGASVFFFPEGTRSKDGKLGAFKVGVSSETVLSFLASSLRQQSERKSKN